MVWKCVFTVAFYLLSNTILICMCVRLVIYIDRSSCVFTCVILLCVVFLIIIIFSIFIGHRFSHSIIRGVCTRVCVSVYVCAYFSLLSSYIRAHASYIYNFFSICWNSFALHIPLCDNVWFSLYKLDFILIFDAPWRNVCLNREHSSIQIVSRFSFDFLFRF